MTLPHHCPRCGWEGTAPDEVKVLFHPCRPPSPRTRRLDQLEGTTLEELMRKVFADLGGGIPAPSIEQAKAETGVTGRRRPGTGFRDDDDVLEI